MNDEQKVLVHRFGQRAFVLVAAIGVFPYEIILHTIWGAIGGIVDGCRHFAQEFKILWK